MIEQSLLLGISTVVLAFLSWRAAAVTPIEEKENILHQQWGDANSGGGKSQKGDFHLLQVYSIMVTEKSGILYTIKKYLTGEAEGMTEINLIMESKSVPSIEEYETHPWHNKIEFRVGKIRERTEESGTAGMTIAVYSAERAEIQYQLQYFGQMTDHIVSRQLEDDSIPEFGEFEFKGIDRTHLIKS